MLSFRMRNLIILTLVFGVTSVLYFVASGDVLLAVDAPSCILAGEDYRNEPVLELEGFHKELINKKELKIR